MRDPMVLVATEGGGLQVSWDAAGRWQPVDMPCDGEILALTVAPTFAEDRRVCIAVHQHDEARAAIWQGTIGGSWECLISHPGTAQRAIVATSPTLAWGGVWYATIDEQLYELCANAVRGRAGEHRPAGAGCALTPEQAAVIDLAVLHTAHATGVLAATERGLYLLAHSEKGWRLFDDDTVPRAIVAVAPSPEYIQDSLIYALVPHGP